MTDYVNKIAVSGATKPIGGTTFKGDWTWYGAYPVSGGSLSAGGVATYDLSNIPSDGYMYEVIGWVAFASSATNGQYGEITIAGFVEKAYVFANSFDTDYVRNKSVMQGGGTFRICVGGNNGNLSNKIRVRATSSAVRDLYVFISWYRRLGTNDIDNNSYMDKIKIPSSTLTPDVVVYGTPTISNGVVSNFNSSNFLEIPGGKQTNNAEYVIKFTTNTYDNTNSQAILCAEKFESLEIYAGTQNVATYNWSAGSGVTLFSTVANTTYWIKIQINGTTKTYSYSTNGTNYTQVASFTDSEIVTAENSFHMRIGNHSNNNFPNRGFKGSIDLNECYINVNGSRFWSGMGYKKTLVVGGNILDGQWVAKNQNVFTGNPTADQTMVYSLSSYLPNDGCDYELMVRGYAYTGTSSGNAIQLKVNSGSTADHSCSSLIVRQRTSTSSFRESASFSVIPIKNSDRNIAILFAGNYASSNASNISLKGYRRVGTNSGSTDSNFVSNIVLPSSQSITIGGEVADNPWVNIDRALFNGTAWSPDGSFTINLKTTTYGGSTLIPNDNYVYELLLSGWMNTGNTSGNWSQMKISSGSFTDGGLSITAQNTRSSSINARRQCVVFPLAVNGELTIYTYGASGKNGTFTLNLHGYRRIGTNK